jgi:outer membrane immunogenic protein
MRKLLLAGVGAAVVAAAPALAADLPAAPVAAPVVAPAPWSWTGFYVGGNGGYSWGNADANGNVAVAVSVNGIPFTTNVRTPQSAGGTDSVNGWLGGGQAGFNWQTGALVVGIEADIQATGQRGSNTFCTNGATTCPAGPFLFGTAPFQLTVDQKLAWFGTARGRIGAGGDRFLFYVTGGAAVGEIKADDASVGSLAPLPVPAALGSANYTKVGWVVGFGVEARLIDNWTAKLEYLYTDLGSFNDTLTTSGSLGTATSTVTTAFNSRLTDSIVRVGLNYKFGWAEPVVTRY